jgi:hypothetical protein
MTDKFPSEEETTGSKSPVPTSVAELHLLVNAMVQVCLSKESDKKKTALPDAISLKKDKKPLKTPGAALSTSIVPSLSIKTTSLPIPRPELNKKSKLYAGVKSVVASYRTGGLKPMVSASASE